MGLPKLIDVVKVKRWKPKLKKRTGGCFLYDWKSLGITPNQFVDVVAGREALLFEKPFVEHSNASNCPWCDFKARSKHHRGVGTYLREHVFTHPGKTILSYQLVKFSKEMYTIKLQLVRRGYHESFPFFVEHSCQDCLNPVVKGREGKCAIPTSTRNRMRSLATLGYPIEHLVNNKKRQHKWSALGLIVLLKNEVAIEQPDFKIDL